MVSMSAIFMYMAVTCPQTGARNFITLCQPFKQQLHDQQHQTTTKRAHDNTHTNDDVIGLHSDWTAAVVDDGLVQQHALVLYL